MALAPRGFRARPDTTVSEVTAAFAASEGAADSVAEACTYLRHVVDPDIADIRPGPQPLADWQVEVVAEEEEKA